MPIFWCSFLLNWIQYTTKKCYTNFFLGKHSNLTENKCTRGTPVNEAMTEAFKRNCEWFESIDRAALLKELREYI